MWAEGLLVLHPQHHCCPDGRSLGKAAGLSSCEGISLRFCKAGKGWKPSTWILHWAGLTQVGVFWGFNQSLLLAYLAKSGERWR